MNITKCDVQCIWGGTLTGVILKSNTVENDKSGPTTKIIGIHGWLDNLNSLLPLAKQLLHRHPNYEIYLYDRAGHGFSSHLPKGFDYSAIQNAQDLRTVVQSLGWNKEKFSIIGHSYGAILGIIYAASYPEEVSYVVAIDALLRASVPVNSYWKTMASNIDKDLKFFVDLTKSYPEELTFDNAVESIQSSRPGITNEAARLLTERSVRRNANNQFCFTRDEALKRLPTFPYTEDIFQNAMESMKAFILFIGAIKPQWHNASSAVPLYKQYYPHFEITYIDGPHHFHMTQVNEVVERIEQYFNKYLHHSSISTIENSKL